MVVVRLRSFILLRNMVEEDAQGRHSASGEARAVGDIGAPVVGAVTDPDAFLLLGPGLRMGQATMASAR